MVNQKGCRTDCQTKAQTSDFYTIAQYLQASVLIAENEDESSHANHRHDHDRVEDGGTQFLAGRLVAVLIGDQVHTETKNEP